MKSVGVRELRQNASALLDEVESTGASVEITSHGRPVARLVPVGRGSSSSYPELVGAGVIHPGRGDILDVAPIDRPPGAPSTDELLAADRGDR